MLETFTAQTFSPNVGETFQLFPDGMPPEELQLVSVTDLGTPSSREAETSTEGLPVRVPFSLLFRSRPGLYLPQRIYRIEHEQLGVMELFLVPLGPDAQGMRFEAVFG